MTLLSSLGAFTHYKLINVNFVAPFGIAVRGKASLKIACIGHFVLGEPHGTI